MSWMLILKIAVLVIIAIVAVIITFSACCNIYFTDRYHGEYTLAPKVRKP